MADELKPTEREVTIARKVMSCFTEQPIEHCSHLSVGGRLIIEALIEERNTRAPADDRARTPEQIADQIAPHGRVGEDIDSYQAVRWQAAHDAAALMAANDSAVVEVLREARDVIVSLDGGNLTETLARIDAITGGSNEAK